MTKAERGEEQLAVYSEEFCPIAELVYKFGAGVTGANEPAVKLVEKTFATVAQDFDRLQKAKDVKLTVFKLAWQSKDVLSQSGKKSQNSNVAEFLNSLNFDQRCYVILADFVGFLVEEIVQITGKDEVEVRKTLATARQKLVEQI